MLVHLAPGAHAPSYKTNGAAGLDLHANESRRIAPGARGVIRTGVHLAIPAGFEGQVRPRSSLSMNYIDVALGTIDSDYRGEICVVVINNSDESYGVEHGDRIAQLVIAPIERVVIHPVGTIEALGETARGAGGFGSTGR